MNKSDQPIRKFNPGTFQSDEEVIEQFVVRQRELDKVLEVLRGNIDLPSCQHVLVVAPRGQGKTMLLARVAAELNPRVPAELKIDSELSERLLPVRFVEDSHEIFNLADFWLETLFYLAQESSKHDPSLAQELQEAHADLTDRWREKELADRVLATVLDAADRLGKKLVLMVENLQALCENVDADFGWQLRGTLQSEPRIMLLATATHRFKGLEDAKEPFFEQFRIIDLERLATEECRHLWEAVSGDGVSEYQIRPLDILTGGNPRLLVIIAGFVQHRSLSQLMEELVTLIDEHTEYFRVHQEVLTKVERRVYFALTDLWRPSSTGEIATRARMDVRIASTMLGRLVSRGVVRFEGTGRKRRYYAAERLHSIYYKLRRERNEAVYVKNLIYFMMPLYGIGKLYEMSDELVEEVASSPMLRKGIEQAITEWPRVEDPSSEIALLALTRWKLEDISDKAKAHAQIKDYNEIVKRFGNTHDILLQKRVAEALIDMAKLKYRVRDSKGATATFDEVVRRFGNSDLPEIQEQVAIALIQKGYFQMKYGGFAQATATYDEVVKRFSGSGVPKKIREQVAEALIERYDEVIEDYEDSYRASMVVPIALSCKAMTEAQMGRAAEALQTCEEFERRLDTYRHAKTWLEWRAIGVRALALMIQKKRRAAMDTFRSAYAAFLVHGVIIYDMQRIVPELIANGALESELIEILSSDKNKSNALTPLIVALQQRTGEEVRAPVEVLEVAEDINKCIEARVANRE